MSKNSAFHTDFSISHKHIKVKIKTAKLLFSKRFCVILYREGEFILDSYKFFENRNCEYYPCHTDIEKINCLFCYCPLYSLNCGGICKILENGVKDCSDCTVPHKAENYELINKKLSELGRWAFMYFKLNDESVRYTGRFAEHNNSMTAAPRPPRNRRKTDFRAWKHY